MCLDLKITYARVRSGGPKDAPAWIQISKNLPLWGTSAFRESRVVLFVRNEFVAEAPWGTFVAGIVHELSHVVLDATRHQFREVEPVVDLTGMFFGYHEFFLNHTTYVRNVHTESNVEKGFFEAYAKKILESLLNTTHSEEYVEVRAGYLSCEEIAYAGKYLDSIRSR